MDLGVEGLFEALVSLTREEAARLGKLHSLQGPVQDKNAESLVQKRFKTSKQSQQSIKPGTGTPPTTGHRWRTHEEAGPADGGF